MQELIHQFQTIVDPSSTLGAFLISVAASLVVGFFTGKAYTTNKMNVKSNQGKIYQGNTFNKK